VPDNRFIWNPYAVDADLTVSPGDMQSGYGEVTLVPGQNTSVAKEEHDKHAAPVTYGAPATGGCDDIDDVYSGKSAGNPEDWKEKGKVRKTYHGGVRPDHMMFESIKVEKAQAQEPFICCPNCKQKVKEVDGAKELYPLPKGLTGVEPIPAFIYQLHACGCRVSAEWAGAYQKEINSRIAGNAPRAVVDMTEQERQSKAEKLQKQLVSLYAQRDKAQDQQSRLIAEYHLVVTTDRLMRLMPGAHNRMMPTKLSPEIKKWAEEKNLKTPPEFKPADKKYEFPNAHDDPVMKKVAYGHKLTAEEFLYGMVDGTLTPAALGSVMAKTGQTKEFMEDAWGYDEDYPMPDLKKANKPKSIEGIIYLPELTGRVSLQMGKEVKQYVSYNEMLGFLKISGYDVEEAKAKWKPLKRKSLLEVNFLPNADGSVEVFMPSKARYLCPDWKTLENFLHGEGYDTEGLHEYRAAIEVRKRPKVTPAQAIKEGVPEKMADAAAAMVNGMVAQMQAAQDKKMAEVLAKHAPPKHRQLHPGLQTLPVGTPPEMPKQAEKDPLLKALQDAWKPVLAEAAKVTSHELMPDGSEKMTVEWAKPGTKSVTTMAEWWQETIKSCSDKGRLSAGYAAAHQLKPLDGVARRDLLDYIQKSDPAMANLARACLVQLESGAVVGVPPAQANAGKTVLTNEKMLSVLAQIQQSLGRHKAFCVQIAQQTLKPGGGIHGAENVLHSVAWSLQRFIDSQEPLSDEANAFVAAYIEAVAGSRDWSGKGTAAVVAGPKPVGTAPEKAPTKEEVQAKLEAMNSEAEAVKKKKFHQQFERTKRKVVIPKKKSGN
jgi:hypothetical protein